MKNLMIMVHVLFIILVLAFAIWEGIAIATYPCAAFESGLLGVSRAPARCVIHDN